MPQQMQAASAVLGVMCMAAVWLWTPVRICSSEKHWCEVRCEVLCPVVLFTAVAVCLCACVLAFLLFFVAGLYVSLGRQAVV